jgi:hypothetical protein
LPTSSFTQGNYSIQHLVFIVQENHSFDNYFAAYPGANGIPPDTSIPVSARGWASGTLAVEAYDVSGYPIGEVLMNVAGIAATRTDVNGNGGTTGGVFTYTVMMPLPDFARVGAATVTGFALTDMPINGGTALGPPLSTPFGITLPP